MHSSSLRTLLAATLLLAPCAAAAQGAAAFLDIPADARSAAMGGAGAALSADAFSAFRNAAPLSSAETRAGGGYTYLPWMRSLIPETTLHAAAAYFKPNAKQAVSLGFRHFTQYGSERTDDNGNALGRLRPRDMAFDIGYSRTIAKGLSAALTGRYVHSDAGTGHTGNAVAFDAGLFDRQTLSRSHALNFGFQTANFGSGIDLRGRRAAAAVAVESGRCRGPRLDAGTPPDTRPAEAGWRLRPAESRAWSGRFGAEYRIAAESRPCGEATAWGDRSAGEQRYGSARRGPPLERRRGRGCGLSARRREFPAARHVDA